MRDISAFAVEGEPTKGSEVLLTVYSGALTNEYTSLAVGLSPAGAEALAAELLTAAGIARGRASEKCEGSGRTEASL